MKQILPRAEQVRILAKATGYILEDLLPDSGINKIVIFGSFAKGEAGKYLVPKRRKKTTTAHSDIDVLLLVEDSFTPPKGWKPHFNCRLYSVYNRKRLEGKYLVQYLVCRKNVYKGKKHQREAAEWGVPLGLGGTNKKIVIYEE